MSNPPGSPEAVANGCTCPVLDNWRGKGVGDPPQWWVSGNCPIHREKKEMDVEISKI